VALRDWSSDHATSCRNESSAMFVPTAEVLKDSLLWQPSNIFRLIVIQIHDNGIYCTSIASRGKNHYVTDAQHVTYHSNMLNRLKNLRHHVESRCLNTTYGHIKSYFVCKIRSVNPEFNTVSETTLSESLLYL